MIHNHITNKHLYWVYVFNDKTGEMIDKSGPYRDMIGVEYVMESKVLWLSERLGVSQHDLTARYEEILPNPLSN